MVLSHESVKNLIVYSHNNTIPLFKIRVTVVPGGNCRQRRNNKAQQKTCKIGILKV